ncbi:MAG: hypothetical protein QOE38_221 [Thermoleophilaceae bacterium]|jgi:uncharacterized membrane-anchored protein|nr:hypothetical protein [Thermoleophilaceae bacterium]
MAVSRTSLTSRITSRSDRKRAPGKDSRAEQGRDGAPAAEIEFSGRARLGRRTKRLVKRIGEEDIAVIDHDAIDRVSGEDLVACGVRCVLNVATSASPRYGNQGPVLMTEAGIHLVDMPGAPLFDVLKDGERVIVRGGRLYRGDELVWEGEVQDREAVTRAYEAGRRGIGEALEAFAANTMTHIREERELVSGNLDLPDFDTSFRDRPALVVVRGVDHKKDLRTLRSYVRDRKPALIGVDGGADAILDEGFAPDMIVGDMDSATDRVLRSGAELVVHAYPDGRAPGRDRLDAMGLPYKVVPAPATSEDVAMLIAAEKGADLIVTVGSHFNLVEFLDKNRQGMSSTFLTRLRVGEILVDAKGVSRLYRPSAGRGPIVIVTLAALATLVVVVATSPSLGPLLDLVWLKLQILLGLK